MKTMCTVLLLATSFLSCPLSVAECTTNRNPGITIDKPDNLYTDHSDGTITDNATGLMWKKCSLGLTGSHCETGTAQPLTWQTALAAANDSTDTGYTDWRLPNVKELASLIEVACHTPSINETFFPNTATTHSYWSSSPVIYNNNNAWTVPFHTGLVYDRDAKENLAHARLVRNSQ